MNKPYYISAQGMIDGTYIRVAGVTRKAEIDTVNELRLIGLNQSFDQLRTDDKVSDSRIQKLCRRMYRQALSRAVTDEDKKHIRKITRNQLLSWKLLVKEDGHIYATNGFHLLEGNENAFPDALIQCAVFKGKDRSIFLDRKEVRGPVNEQIEEAVSFVMRNIRMGSRIDGLYRKDFYELPLSSIREMISNAVCHRSYIRRGRVQVAVYDDRLEVTSPGRLSNELTVEDLKEGNSKIRNSAIAAAFSYMHLIESWGTGIPRIFRESAQYGLKEPKLENIGIAFRITIFRKPFETDIHGVIEPEQEVNPTQSAHSFHPVHPLSPPSPPIVPTQSARIFDGKLGKSLSPEEAQVFNLLLAKPKITQSQIAEELAWNVNKVKYYLHKLRQQGRSSRTGTNRNGQWICCAG